MSGFVGLLSTNEVHLDIPLLTKMTAAMGFRGPHDQQTWTTPRIGLGHALYRTTCEVPHAAQPFTLDGEVWIVADARIDQRDGAPDEPDVERILRTYLARGEACLDQLIGDFAFLVWDGRRQRLLAARDHFGVSQLFYAQVDGALLLGNTLQSLLVHPRLADELDELALADVALYTMYLDDAATAYSRVRRLPPAHKLTWDHRGVRIERYWTLRQPAPLRYRRNDEYAEHFRALFDQAVGDRLRTDRVGCQLSGGMDSTSVAVTAHQLLQAGGRAFELRAYSAEYPSLIADEEGTLAAEVARHAGFPVDVLAGDSYLDAASSADRTWAPPEPGAATLRVMEEICLRTAAFAPVLLTGYGGDPLLAPPQLSWRRTLAAWRHRAWKWPPRRVTASLRSRQWRRRAHPLPAWVNQQWARHLDLAARATHFQQRARRDQVAMLVGPLWRALFAWSDAGYHGYPLAIRFPFFDLRLLEFALAIPPVPWLENKHVLRAAMGDRLPERVRTRPKTVMPGDVVLEHNKRRGVPAWQVDVLGMPEMEPYVDQDWLRAVQRQSVAGQAHVWATQRPPVQLGYWLRHRERRGGPTLQPARPSR